jgi:ATP-dependent DNA helicase RecQ
MDKNETLKYYFGYDKLKIEQEEIIDSVLEGKDTIGVLPTGFGKSITFQLPALMFAGITIVVTPLIALMQDQVLELKEKNIYAEYINSLQTKEEQNEIYERLLKYKIKILYVSAERLLNEEFINLIKRIKIDFFVCDEAHTLLWSEDFRKALGLIPLFIKKLSYRPKMLALTATATPKTINKIIRLLELNNPNIIKNDCDRNNIYYRIIKTNNKDEELIKYLKDKNEHILIYCLTIKNVIHVYNLLKDKFKVLVYHGALDSNMKKYALEAYRNNKCKIIVCTNSFGMGINIKDIRYVIEYDIPASIEDLVQQLGRASRDGKYAEGVVLFNINDIKTIEYFINSIDDEEKSYSEIVDIKREKIDKLDKVINLCLSKKCIRKNIANYFGFKTNFKCMMCSNCKKS